MGAYLMWENNAGALLALKSLIASIWGIGKVATIAVAK